MYIMYNVWSTPGGFRHRPRLPVRLHRERVRGVPLQPRQRPRRPPQPQEGHPRHVALSQRQALAPGPYQQVVLTGP